MEDIERLKQGDLKVFSEIFEEFHAPLYRYVLNRTQSEYHADEVVQLTFIKLWKYRANLSIDHSLSTQIFQIARSVLIDEIRKLQTKSKEKYSLLINTRPNTCVNEGVKNLEYQDLENMLDKAVNSMPPVRQKVFKLSRSKSLSSKEISKRLSISPKTVDNHIYLALKHIKSLFSITLVFVLFVLIF